MIGLDEFHKRTIEHIRHHLAKGELRAAIEHRRQEMKYATATKALSPKGQPRPSSEAQSSLRLLGQAIFEGAAWTAAARLNYIHAFHFDRWAQMRLDEVWAGIILGAPWVGLENIDSPRPSPRHERGPK